MKSVTRAVAVVLATVFTFSAALAASPEEMVKGAKALEESFLKAFNEHNAEALAAMYWNSPDAVFMPPDAMVVRGPAAIKESFAHMATTMSGCKLTILESHSLPVGEVVLGWGLWRMTMPGPDGKPMEMEGRYSDVKAQRDGKWVYLMDHASVPAPSEPAPEAAHKH